MFATPQKEHEWFQDLMGEWHFAHECSGGPDGSPLRAEGDLSVSSLQGMWTLIEMSGLGPEGNPFTSLFTLGYDIEQQQYVGSFVGSMMSQMWLYKGQRDETGRKLVLNTIGPRMDGAGKTNYQDVIEKIDEDHWKLNSFIQNEDGSWIQFMDSLHTRKS